MGENGYWLMDGRANYDVDKALVLESCYTLEDARKSWHDYGNDTCIVDVKTQTIVDSLLWHKSDDPMDDGLDDAIIGNLP